MREQDGLLIYEPDDTALIPERKQDGNKGTFGHALIIAGCAGMCGAAYFSALAAYRTGAGLVRILTPEENRVILQTLLPEAIVTAYDPEEVLSGSDAWKALLSELMEWSTAVVLGPGLGREDYVRALTEDVMQAAYVPLIIDADGLNAIAANPYLTGFYTENIIITPHVGEMARLTGRKIPEILADRVKTAEEYRNTYGITCCLKSDRTVTAAVDGKNYRTESGTPALAKGGSGDVLTGIIAGFLCLGMEPGEAAAFGCHIHGTAGRKAAEQTSVHGVLAREIAEAIPAVMRMRPGTGF